MYYSDMARRLNKKIFTLEDLYLLYPSEKRASIRSTVYRMVKRGSLISLKRGLYKTYSSIIDQENIGCMIYPNSYLTAETVLARYHIVIPGEIDFPRQVDVYKQITLVHNSQSFSYEHPTLHRKYKYSKIKPELFFGFKKKICPIINQTYYEATLEKALLDMVYLRKPFSVETVRIDRSTKDINYRLFEKLLTRYPKWMHNLPWF